MVTLDGYIQIQSRTHMRNDGNPNRSILVSPLTNRGRSKNLLNTCPALEAAPKFGRRSANTRCGIRAYVRVLLLGVRHCVARGYVELHLEADSQKVLKHTINFESST